MAIMSGMRRASGMSHEPFVTAPARATWSISWLAPIPSSAASAEPPMESMGLSLCRAFAIPGMALATPGVVAITTPSPPVMRPHASAMNDAACSWRVSMNRKSPSAITSIRGSVWSPAMVKMLTTPSLFNAWVMRWLPVRAEGLMRLSSGAGRKMWPDYEMAAIKRQVKYGCTSIS